MYKYIYVCIYIYLNPGALCILNTYSAIEPHPSPFGNFESEKKQ